MATTATWVRCSCCGGWIPPEHLWGAPGEDEEGDCPGNVNVSGTCGGFAERDAYDEDEDDTR